MSTDKLQIVTLYNLQFAELNLHIGGYDVSVSHWAGPIVKIVSSWVYILKVWKYFWNREGQVPLPGISSMYLKKKKKLYQILAMATNTSHR